MTPEARIAELEAENTALRGQVELLAARVEELQARLAKDSHNSGKPPSSDGLARMTRKTKSLRKPSGKKAGGQLGHRGETLRLVATPDTVVEHRPPTCAACQASLEGATVVLRERRQVRELPVVRLVVQEHQALHVRCPVCQAVTVGAFPAEVASRAQYGPRLRALAVYLVEAQFVPFGRTQQLLADLLEVQLARGTLVGWVRAGRLAPWSRWRRRSRRHCGGQRCCTTTRPACAAAGGWSGRMSPVPAGSPTTPATPSADRRRPTPSASCRTSAA
jgi:transposase